MRGVKPQHFVAIFLFLGMVSCTVWLGEHARHSPADDAATFAAEQLRDATGPR